jgi:hypothetical protein
MQNAVNSSSQTSHRGQTGPKSLAGKKISSMNALKSGVFAKSPILPFEDAKAYARHIKDVMLALDPQDVVQRGIAQQIADSFWRGSRQELRACVHREQIFKEASPQVIAGLMGLPDERAALAPAFWSNPQYKMSKAAKDRFDECHSQYVHFAEHTVTEDDYHARWRYYPELFEYLNQWLADQVAPSLFCEDGKDLHASWKKQIATFHLYLKRFGHYLWYGANFKDRLPQIRNTLAIWYFVASTHRNEVDRYDEIVIKERRNCQGLLVTYFQMRKSLTEQALMAQMLSGAIKSPMPMARPKRPKALSVGIA